MLDREYKSAGQAAKEPGHKKNCFQVSNQVCHKARCTATEDGNEACNLDLV